MKDISTRSDIEKLILHFYAELLKDKEMQHVFHGLDFEKHVPNIVAFWAFVLLDEEGYKTNVFDKHLHLPIKPEHFDFWLNTFTQAVNSLFAGEKANLAISRATVLAFTFKSKWEKLKGYS